MKIETLIRGARAACKWRGHDMQRFSIDPGRLVAYSECRKCKQTCTVLVSPLPNQIDVGGRAVALTCPSEIGKERSPNGRGCEICAAPVSAFQYRKNKGLCKDCVPD